MLVGIGGNPPRSVRDRVPGGVGCLGLFGTGQQLHRPKDGPVYNDNLFSVRDSVCLILIFCSFYFHVLISEEETRESPQSHLTCFTSLSPYQRRCTSKFIHNKFVECL